jgi:DNA-binding GntR family transcriptional regulator
MSAQLKLESLRSTPERVADAISKGILQRRYAVGQRLVEIDLIRDLGVSRSTLREAFRILATSGVIELTPHRGAVIRTLTPDDARNLMAVLEVLSGLAARLAALNIHIGTNAARLQSAAKRLLRERWPDDMLSLMDDRARYYQVLFEIADNKELERALPNARAHMLRNQVFDQLTQTHLRSMMSEYASVTEAVLAGDSVKADQRMRRHIVKTSARTLASVNGRDKG